MKYEAEVFETAEDLIELVTASEMSAEEKLGALERAGIECYLTAEGVLTGKYWQIITEDFVSPEEAAVIRTSRPSPEDAGGLDWLSRNLRNIREQYGGQWIAIADNAIAASASSLPELLGQIAELEKPFVTFISSEPVVWSFTYANKKL